jgi:hypothetical protein
MWFVLLELLRSDSAKLNTVTLVALELMITTIKVMF